MSSHVEKRVGSNQWTSRWAHVLKSWPSYKWEELKSNKSCYSQIWPHCLWNHDPLLPGPIFHYKAREGLELDCCLLSYNNICLTCPSPSNWPNSPIYHRPGGPQNSGTVPQLLPAGPSGPTLNSWLCLQSQALPLAPTDLTPASICQYLSLRVSLGHWTLCFHLTLSTLHSQDKPKEDLYTRWSFFPDTHPSCIHTYSVSPCLTLS